MSSHDHWVLGPPRPVSWPPSSHHSMDSDILTRLQQNQLWAWLNTNQAVVLPIALLVASVLLSSNILDLLVLSATAVVPETHRQLLWDATVTALPESFVFWLEDRMAPSRRSASSRSSAMTTSTRTKPRTATAAGGISKNRHQAKSDALANALGLGPLGRRRNLASSYGEKLNRLARSAARTDPNRPRGLLNNGNWCYQNVILQGLSSLNSMDKYLENALDEAVDIDTGTMKALEKKLKTVVALRDLIGELREPVGSQSYLQAAPELMQIKGQAQQDAQEYLLKLLDTVEVELQKVGVISANSSLALTPPRPSTPVLEAAVPMSRSNSVSSISSEATVTSCSGTITAPAQKPSSSFRLPLEALVAERKACKACGYSEGMSLDPTCCIILNMPCVNPSNDKSVYGLEDLLDNFCEGEVLDGVDCSNCTLLRLRDKLIQEKEASSEAHPDAQQAEDEDGVHQETGSAALEERLAEIETALSTKTFDDNTLLNKCKVQKSDIVRSDKAKQIGFARAPPGLAIQINRSSYMYYAVKNMRPVHFPPVLDFSPWYLGSALPNPSHSVAVDSLQGRDKEIVQDLERRPEKAVYVLRSAVMHNGTAHSGHYYCYRQHSAGDAQEETRRASSSAPPNTQTHPTSVRHAPGPASASSRTASIEGTPCDFDDDGTTVAGSEYEVQPDSRTRGRDAEADDSGSETDMEPARKKQKLATGAAQDKAPEEATVHRDTPWWYLSDCNVYSATEGEVFSQPEKAYMLFYDRVSGAEATKVLAAAAKYDKRATETDSDADDEAEDADAETTRDDSVEVSAKSAESAKSAKSAGESIQTSIEVSDESAEESIQSIEVCDKSVESDESTKESIRESIEVCDKSVESDESAEESIRESIEVSDKSVESDESAEESIQQSIEASDQSVESDESADSESDYVAGDESDASYDGE